MQGKEETVLGESSPVYLPGSDDKTIRGEFLEVDLSNTYNDIQKSYRRIFFNLEEIFEKETSVLSEGCLPVYVEISLVPKGSLDFKEEK